MIGKFKTQTRSVRINLDWKVEPFCNPPSSDPIGVTIVMLARDLDDSSLAGIYTNFHPVFFGEIKKSSMSNFLFYLATKMQEDLIYYLKHKQKVTIGCYLGWTNL